mmetsp:Transcript_8421/g.52638  ORF Transcript_8421/g.52638 Transcript_8421/m.52638 type:complete len:200 (+) Transcript_8421:199-798(+)
MLRNCRRKIFDSCRMHLLGRTLTRQPLLPALLLCSKTLHERKIRGTRVHHAMLTAKLHRPGRRPRHVRRKRSSSVGEQIQGEECQDWRQIQRTTQRWDEPTEQIQVGIAERAQRRHDGLRWVGKPRQDQPSNQQGVVDVQEAEDSHCKHLLHSRITRDDRRKACPSQHAVDWSRLRHGQGHHWTHESLRDSETTFICTE